MKNITYKKPETEAEIADAKNLILEYIKWLNTDLCFQKIDNKPKYFPDKYKEPEGAFIIPKENNAVVRK